MNERPDWLTDGVGTAWRTVRGSHWGDGTVADRGSRTVELHRGAGDRTLLLCLTDHDDEDPPAGADEIRLDPDGAAQLMRALGDYLLQHEQADAETYPEHRRDETLGPTVHGIIGLNGRWETCFFPTSTAAGVMIPGTVHDTEQIRRFFTAIGNAPARRLTHSHLRLLDPPPDA